MGAGAGSMLFKEIKNIQRFIKISSPYLSPKMVEELVRLDNQGIYVSLITSAKMDEINNRQGKTILALVVQHRHLNKKAL